jgi:hypothetical protein
MALRRLRLSLTDTHFHLEISMFETISPAKQTQYAIAAGFLSFGIASLAAPRLLSNVFASDTGAALPIVTLAIGGLGAHALACGLFAAFARFKSWTYPGFALSLLPVLAADYWLYAKAGAFNEMALVHAGGMVAILALCVRGFRQLQHDETVAAQAV